MTAQIFEDFTHEEILALHGLGDYQDDCQDDDSGLAEIYDDSQCCSGCMNCLGGSWSDFF